MFGFCKILFLLTLVYVLNFSFFEVVIIIELGGREGGAEMKVLDEGKERSEGMAEEEQG